MKSAYEMALARMGLKESKGSRTLTDAQRAELSSVDRRYAAKIAEREIVLRGEMDKAREAGNDEECEKMRELLQRERAEFEEERELSKELIRKGTRS
jgi:hypothetical protein